MLLDWTCQDCKAVETYDVDKGSVAETLDWWRGEVKDYLCADCGLRNRIERIDGGYYLD